MSTSIASHNQSLNSLSTHTNLVMRYSHDRAQRLMFWLTITVVTRPSEFSAGRQYTHVHAFFHKELLSGRLCVLLSCVPFANLPFAQVNIFQTLRLTARFIVQVHCQATKGERELDDDF